jgi:hypothetical protein
MWLERPATLLPVQVDPHEGTRLQMVRSRPLSSLELSGISTADNQSGIVGFGPAPLSDLAAVYLSANPRELAGGVSNSMIELLDGTG